MSNARFAGAERRIWARAAGTAALLLAVAASSIGCSQPGGNGWGGGPQSASVTVPSFAPLVQEVLPAVVNVSAVQRPSKTAENRDANAGFDQAKDEAGTSRLAPSALDELLRRFFEQQERKGEPNEPGLALGSGFIIDPRGYVVTDDHVLENADAVIVTFHDATRHPARIIGRDSLTDLALLKIDAQRPLPYVRWGNSDAAQVGDWVLAVGNPFGLSDTVSSGIISARGRDIHAGPYDDFLQIDAAINRGNSGGPTFNLDGAVIGINTAIYSPNGGSVGIGFAIPANLAKPVVAQLEEYGKVQRGWLGVQIQPVTPEIAQSFGLAQVTGALVAGVSANGPAARAGFAPGDVILSVDGHDIERMRDLPLVVADMPIGRIAQVTVWRQNRAIGLRPVIGQMPETPEAAAINQDENADRRASPADLGTGLELAPLTAQRRSRLRVGANVAGVVVTGIAPDGPFAGLDLLPGDVIETINRQPAASPADTIAKFRQAATRGAGVLLLQINRHGSSRFLTMRLGGGAKGDSG